MKSQFQKIVLIHMNLTDVEVGKLIIMVFQVKKQSNCENLKLDNVFICEPGHSYSLFIKGNDYWKINNGSQILMITDLGAI